MKNPAMAPGGVAIERVVFDGIAATDCHGRFIDP
jgi:hypothetical protein